MNFLNKFSSLAFAALFLLVSSKAFSGEIYVLNLTNRPIQYAYSEGKFIEQRWRIASRNQYRSDVITVMPGKLVGSKPTLMKGAITLGDLEKQMRAGKEIVSTLCTVGASCLLSTAGPGGLAACPAAAPILKFLTDQGLSLVESEALAALTRKKEDNLGLTAEKRSQVLMLTDGIDEDTDAAADPQTGRRELAERVADAAVTQLAPEQKTLFGKLKRFCKKFSEVKGKRRIFDFTEDQNPIIYIVVIFPA